MHKYILLIITFCTSSIDASCQSSDSSVAQANLNQPLWQFSQIHGVTSESKRFKIYTIVDNQTKDYIRQQFFFDSNLPGPDMRGACRIQAQKKVEAYTHLNTFLLDCKEKALSISLQKILEKRPDLDTLLLPLTQGFTAITKNNKYTYQQTHGKTSNDEKVKTYSIIDNKNGNSIEEKFIFPSNSFGDPDLESKHIIKGNSDQEEYLAYRDLDNILCCYKETAFRQAIQNIIQKDPQLQPLIKLSDGYIYNSHSTIQINQHPKLDPTKSILMRISTIKQDTSSDKK